RGEPMAAPRRLSAGCRCSSRSDSAGRAPTAASPASAEKLVVRRRTVRFLLVALAEEPFGATGTSSSSVLDPA
ncbi:MAG TPA: hypothetical protein VM688_03835, partial [Nocardioidaceae bacterium]|nr:hypothetical protein [Nocardioidaceae bacterium]